MIGPRPKMGFQREWRGNKIVALNILVHPDEFDIPNRQLGSLMLSPDPPPKRNARPEPYDIDETSYMITEGGQALLTQGSTSILSAPITPSSGTATATTTGTAGFQPDGFQPDGFQMQISTTGP